MTSIDSRVYENKGTGVVLASPWRPLAALLYLDAIRQLNRVGNSKWNETGNGLLIKTARSSVFIDYRPERDDHCDSPLQLKKKYFSNSL